MEKKLKAYLVAFNVMEAVTDIETGKTELKPQVRTTCIVAYTKAEAGDIFVKWLKLRNLFNNVNGVVVTRVKRTRQNAHLLREDFYEKELALFK